MPRDRLTASGATRAVADPGSPDGDGNDAAQRIEAAAIRLFSRHGFSGTGIRDIGKEAGLSLSTLYYYSSNKEDLLFKIMYRALDDLLGPAREIATRFSEAPARVEALVDLHVRFHAADPLLNIVADTEVRSLNQDNRKMIVALRDEYEKVWTDTIADGVAKGHFRTLDARIATLALVEMCNGVAHWYRPSGRLGLDRLCQEFISIALAALGVDVSAKVMRPTRQRSK